jgi:hypothetical protein
MDDFSTKQKGDIAEYRVITELLKRGYNVLKPVGDRLPYDLAVDIDGRLVRIQVKWAWYDDKTDRYSVDTRRSQTNRAVYKITKYEEKDFEFLIAWVFDKDVFYIFPTKFAASFGGNISIVEGVKRQRPPRSAEYRSRWDLLDEIPTLVQDDLCGVEQSGSSTGS